MLEVHAGLGEEVPVGNSGKHEAKRGTLELRVLFKMSLGDSL